MATENERLESPCARTHLEVSLRARRGPNALADCPLTAAFAAIRGKWKLTLVYWLAHGELHFAGLRRRAAPISPKVLTE